MDGCYEHIRDGWTGKRERWSMTEVVVVVEFISTVQHIYMYT